MCLFKCRKKCCDRKSSVKCTTMNVYNQNPYIDICPLVKAIANCLDNCHKPCHCRYCTYENYYDDVCQGCQPPVPV